MPLSCLDIGVVCESIYTPESEHADLRIMSFDVTTCGTAHLMTMVFSDSSIKVRVPAPMTCIMVLMLIYSRPIVTTL